MKKVTKVVVQYDYHTDTPKAKRFYTIQKPSEVIKHISPEFWNKHHIRFERNFMTVDKAKNIAIAAERATFTD